MYLLPAQGIRRNTIHHMDLFRLCNALGNSSVDMILCDLPYGTTACSWDTIIPIEPMWAQFKRIIKPRGSIVLTATEPFASHLRMSNLDMYKYDWVWDKVQPSGQMLVSYQPMQQHELILVFCKSTSNYYPIFTDRKSKDVRINAIRNKQNQKNQIAFAHLGYANQKYANNYNPLTVNPKSILSFSKQPTRKAWGHPTQKPVKLFEYLIKTYTQPGELVFDPCVGSGTTAVAARNTGRDYICGDFTRDYVELARGRVQNSDPFQDSVDKKTGIKQLSLFSESGA